MGHSRSAGRLPGAGGGVEELSERFYGAVDLEAELEGILPRARKHRMLALVLEGEGSLWWFDETSEADGEAGSVRVPAEGSGRWVRRLAPPAPVENPDEVGPRFFRSEAIFSRPSGVVRDFDATVAFDPALWFDGGGTGNATNATANKRPEVRFGPSGRPGVFFDGASNKWLADNDANADAEYTIIASFSFDSSQAAGYGGIYTNRPWGAPVGGTETLLGIDADKRAAVYQTQVTPTVSLGAPHESPIAIDTPTVVSLVVKGARRYLYRDSIFINADDSDQSNLTTKRAVFLGGEDGDSQFGGYTYRALYASAALSRDCRHVIERGLMALHGLEVPPFLIYMDGDSRVQAIAPGLSTLVAHMEARLTQLGAPAHRVVNMARSGQQVLTMANNAPYLIAPGYHPRALCIAYLGSFHNSIKNVGLSASDIQGHIAQYAATVRSAGFRLLVATTPESSALAPFTIKLSAVNAWVLSTFGSDAVDIAGIPGLTYADADHEDDAGYTLEGLLLATKIGLLMGIEVDP